MENKAKQKEMFVQAQKEQEEEKLQDFNSKKEGGKTRDGRLGGNWSKGWETRRKWAEGKAAGV